jgi:Clustered mitochondria/Translation initiation factor eIF3 subunit 135
VAGQELNGLMAYSNCKMAGLCLPLMALVDFMGHRVIAMSWLPIDSSTIVYGTPDACRHVYKDAELDEIMAQCAELLNLRAHWVGRGSQRTYLHSACDVEGHRSRVDDSFYLLDFSRTLPPTRPDKRIPNGHLFQLFRREWLQAYSLPLCPDAFSGFIVEDSSRLEYNCEARCATNALLATIPSFVQGRLLQAAREARRNAALDQLDLTQLMHGAGINMRYTGIVLRHTPPEAVTARTLLIVEVLARVFKNELRRRLSDLNRRLAIVLMAPYRQLVVDFFNLIFGRVGDDDGDSDAENDGDGSASLTTTAGAAPSSRSGDDDVISCEDDKNGVTCTQRLWNVLLRSEMELKFYLRDIDIGEIHVLVRDGLVHGVRVRYLLLSRIAELANLKFTRGFVRNMRLGLHFDEHVPLDIMDLHKIRVSVKHTNVVTCCEAQYYYLKALEALKGRSSSEASELLQKSKSKYLQALRSDPNNADVLLGIALVCYKLTEFNALDARNMANCSFSMFNPLVLETESFFERAMAANDRDAETIHHYARFLIRCNRFDRAEYMFIQSLLIDPSNPRCLKSYGFFLSERGLFDDAELFFQRARSCENILRSSSSQ